MRYYVEQYTCIHPDRGLERDCDVSETLDPIEYSKNIKDDVCAFRFKDKDKVISPFYFVGEKKDRSELSPIALFAYSIDENDVIMQNGNGCLFNPSDIGEGIILSEYKPEEPKALNKTYKSEE